jgi:hypothetical protein
MLAVVVEVIFHQALLELAVLVEVLMVHTPQQPIMELLTQAVEVGVLVNQYELAAQAVAVS